MDNFWWLYKFEFKKIMNRKIVWVIFFFISVVLFCTVFAMTLLPKDKNGISVYEKNKLILSYEKGHKAPLLDQNLLDKTIQVLQQQDKKTAKYYYYEEIKHYIQLEVDKELTEITAKDFYAARQTHLDKNLQEMKLTKQEIEYWTKQETKIPKPFIYHTTIGAEQIWRIFYEAVVLVLLAIGIGLANVFADEEHNKMTQINKSTRLGKKCLFYSKIATGMTYSLICTCVIVVSLILPLFLVFHSFGLQQSVLLALPDTSMSFTIGHMIVWYFIVLLVVALLFGMMTMFGSELFQSGVAILGVMFALLLFGMIFHVPEEYRVASQIFSFLPTDLLGVWSVYDVRLVSLFGIHVTSLQIAPILYIILSAFFFIFGKKINFSLRQ